MKNALFLHAEVDGYAPSQVRRTLTVRELIAVLEEYDEDAPVYLSYDRGNTYGAVLESKFEDYYEDEEE